MVKRAIAPHTSERLLDCHRAARYLAVSYWTIREIMHRGELPFVRAGRKILIDRQDLDSWIEQNKQSWKGR